MEEEESKAKKERERGGKRVSVDILGLGGSEVGVPACSAEASWLRIPILNCRRGCGRRRRTERTLTGRASGWGTGK
jgi:hypothetical protein